MKKKIPALATPAVRRLASEYGINITEIQGSGKEGRVLKEDILIFLNNQSSEKVTVKESAIPTPSVPAPEKPKQPAVTEQPIRRPVAIQTVTQDRTEPVKGITKAMIKSMSEALKIPHFGYKDEIDMTNLVELKKQLKITAEKRGVKFTYMPVILKACSLALTQYPILNSTFDPIKETITYKVRRYLLSS